MRTSGPHRGAVFGHVVNQSYNADVLKTALLPQLVLANFVIMLFLIFNFPSFQVLFDSESSVNFIPRYVGFSTLGIME